MGNRKDSGRTSEDSLSKKNSRPDGENRNHTECKGHGKEGNPELMTNRF